MYHGIMVASAYHGAFCKCSAIVPFITFTFY